eukprot:413046_1
MTEAKTSCESEDKPLAVITGVSKGIGYYSAMKLIEKGYIVAGCARNTNIMQELDKKYANHSFIAVDVSDAEQVKKWSNLIITKYGSPQLLINNAGVAADKVLIENASIDVLNKIIDVNTKGVMFVIKYFMKAMKENIKCKSKIITISSASGRNGYASMSPYCASKFAIEGLMISISKELPQHMMCCAYDPGGIITDMTVYLVPELKGQISNAIKMGAIGAKQWAIDCIPHILSLNRHLHNGKQMERPNCKELFQKNWMIYMQIKKRVLASQQ